MEYKNELKKLKALVSKDTWECLKEHDAIIAGGALTSVFCNREVNDLDVYFRCEEDFIAFIEDVWNGGEYTSSHFLIANNITDRSILFKDKRTEQYVQVIVYKWFESVDDLFKDYDFTVNMCAVACKDDSFVFHADFLKHNAQRHLSFNQGTAYPLISALRVQKYTERGYTIPKAQMLRILLAVNAKQIDSWEKLKDEVGGMYGLNMDEVFPEDKDFSLDLAMDTLASLDYDETYKMGAKAGGLAKEHIYDKIFKGEKEDASNKMFKWST